MPAQQSMAWWWRGPGFPCLPPPPLVGLASTGLSMQLSMPACAVHRSSLHCTPHDVYLASLDQQIHLVSFAYP